jgi:uncharacterized protein (TIGR00369 family)
MRKTVATDRVANISEIERLFETAPFIRALGMELVAIAPGRCETALQLDERHLQQDGVVHAGVLATMADHTSGSAGASIIGADEYVLTAEFKINLLRTARGDRLYCVGSVLKPGRRLIVSESEVFDGNPQEARLVAKAIVTLAVMTKPSEAKSDQGDSPPHMKKE